MNGPHLLCISQIYVLISVIVVTILVNNSSSKLDVPSDKHHHHAVPTGSVSNGSAKNEHIDDVENHVKFYKNAFKVKRREQLNAIKSVLSIDNTKKRNTLVSDLISGMFKVMNEAKELIELKNYHAKDKFPFDNTQLKEAIAIVVENMAFLCEFALRFPSIVNKRYSTDYKFKTVVQWSYQFSEETDLYDENSMKLLNLCGQQLNFIPRDENFVNPYDKKQIKEDIEREAVKKIDEARMKKMEQKKFEKHKKLKKPTLSRTEL